MYNFSLDHVFSLKLHCFEARLSMPERFHFASAEQLQSCYNGIGPEQPFSSEQMVQWALENGMTTKQMQEYVPTFQNISLNLLHNGRNWDELFPAPAQA